MVHWGLRLVFPVHRAFVRSAIHGELGKVPRVVICSWSGEADEVQLGFDGAGFCRVFTLFFAMQRQMARRAASLVATTSKVNTPADFWNEGAPL